MYANTLGGFHGIIMMEEKMEENNIEEAKTLLMPKEKKYCRYCKSFKEAVLIHDTVVDTGSGIIGSNKSNILDVKIDLMARINKDDLYALGEILCLTPSDMTQYCEIRCEVACKGTDRQDCSCKKWRAKVA